MFSKKAPYVPSFSKQLRLIGKKLSLEPNKKLIDLGCGDGKALRYFAKQYGLQQLDGYDFNVFAIWTGKLLNTLYGRRHINLYRQRFDDVDLSSYDYIYMYLRPSQIADMEKWVFTTAKQGTLIISAAFHFPDKKPIQIIREGMWRVYVYEV